jgi:hypothetical protein
MRTAGLLGPKAGRGFYVYSRWVGSRGGGCPPREDP